MDIVQNSNFNCEFNSVYRSILTELASNILSSDGKFWCLYLNILMSVCVLYKRVTIEWLQQLRHISKPYSLYKPKSAIEV
jgi:hypothetical protein